MGLFSALRGLFGRRSENDEDSDSDDRISVTAQFNHKIGPLDRGERYEEPLSEFLSKQGYGETDGGGTMQTKEGEIEFCDVHMLLTSPEVSIPFIVSFLEGRGAPKGSVLKAYDNNGEVKTEIPFGTREGFAIYLDGVNQPAEVYKTCDSNFVVSEINKLLAGHGQIEGTWQGPTETALYIYGNSAVRMKALIQDFLGSYPLCRGARVVVLTL